MTEEIVLEDQIAHFLVEIRNVATMQKDLAMDAMNQLHDQVESLFPLINHVIDRAKERQVDTQHHLEAIITETARTEQQLNDVQAKVGDIQAKIARVQAEEVQTEKLVEELRNEQAHLERELQKHRDQLEELSKWFWVPGYGQYLGIKSLVDNDTGNLQSISNDLQNNFNELQSKQILLNELQEQNRGYEAIRSTLNAQLAELSKIRSDLEASQKSLARAVTDLSTFSLFLNFLNIKLSKVVTSIEDVQDVLDFLEKGETLQSEGLVDVTLDQLVQSIENCIDFMKTEKEQQNVLDQDISELPEFKFYAIRSRSSGYYLDGRGGQSDPLMTNRPPSGDAYLQWSIIPVDGFSALKSKSSRFYLDGRAGQPDPLMTNRNPEGDNYLQWSIEEMEDGYVAIKSRSSGYYLDGRGGESNPLMTNRPPRGDTYLQWSLIQMDL